MSHESHSHLIAGILLLAGQASADITQAEWNDETDFTFAVSYMPDLDQKRAGLICDGKMFCVPTSAMNLFSYAAEWGFEDVNPGPGVYQGDVGYDLMSLWIAVLGDEMNTSQPSDPDDDPCKNGTTGTAWYNATADWLDGHPINHYRVGKNADQHTCPTLSTAAYAAATGAIVNICYGRYNANPGSLILGDRTGGHCVTVVYAHADGPNDLELWVRDPGGDNNLNSQSPWAYNIYDVETKTIQEDWDDNASYHQVAVTTINYDNEDDTIRLIDSLHVLKPYVGYSWSTVELNIDPVGGDFGVAPPSAGYMPAQGFEIAGVGQGFPQQVYYVLATQGQIATLTALDPLTGAESTLATLSGATDLVVDRRGDIFVLAGLQLLRLNTKGQVQQTYQLPFPFQAMAVRDATDELIMLSTTHQEMFTFDIASSQLMPNGFIPIPPSQNPSIAVRESDGVVAVLAREFNDLVYGIQLDVQPKVQTFNIQELDATAIAFDDQEHLVISTGDGQVKDFEPGNQGWWDWDKPDTSFYTNAKSLGEYKVSMSRSNYNPKYDELDDLQTPVDDLDYHGVIVYDCAADLNADGVLNILDFVKFQSLWLANDPAADCDFNDLYNILDFVCFQALFQKGCP